MENEEAHRSYLGTFWNWLWGWAKEEEGKKKTIKSKVTDLACKLTESVKDRTNDLINRWIYCNDSEDEDEKDELPDSSARLNG